MDPLTNELTKQAAVNLAKIKGLEKAAARLTQAKREALSEKQSTTPENKEKRASYDLDWLKNFEGTPLYHQALLVAKAEIADCNRECVPTPLGPDPLSDRILKVRAQLETLEAKRAVKQAKDRLNRPKPELTEETRKKIREAKGKLEADLINYKLGLSKSKSAHAIGVSIARSR